MLSRRELVVVDCSFLVAMVVLLAVFAHGGRLIAGSIALAVLAAFRVRDWTRHDTPS